MKENKRIINSEYILDIVFSTIISIAFIYFLSSTGFFMFFAAIPFIVLSVKYGYIESSISFIISLIISALLIDIYIAIYAFVFILSIGLSISIMIRKKQSLEKVLIYTTIVSFSLIILGLGIFYFISDTNPILVIKNTFIEAINSFENVIKNDINFDSKEITNQIVLLKSMVDYIISVLPALLLISSITVAISNSLISIKLLNKTGIDIYKNIKINRVNIIKSLSPLMSFMSLIFVIFYIGGFENSDLFINNISTILMFLLFLNGVLLLDYLMEDRFNPFVRFLIIILIVFLLQGFLLIAILGLLDGIMNFKKKIEAQRNG